MSHCDFWFFRCVTVGQISASFHQKKVDGVTQPPHQLSIKVSLKALKGSVDGRPLLKLQELLSDESLVLTAGSP